MMTLTPIPLLPFVEMTVPGTGIHPIIFFLATVGFYVVFLGGMFLIAWLCDWWQSR